MREVWAKREAWGLGGDVRSVLTAKGSGKVRGRARGGGCLRDPKFARGIQHERRATEG